MNATSGHLRVLGILEVVYGIVHLLGGLAIGGMSLLGCGICASSQSAAEGLAAGAAWGVLWGAAGLVVALLSAVVVAAGLALVNGRSWAKIATLVFAVLMIAEFPIGTAFAVYAFWAILFDKSRSW